MPPELAARASSKAVWVTSQLGTGKGQSHCPEQGARPNQGLLCVKKNKLCQTIVSFWGRGQHRVSPCCPGWPGTPWLRDSSDLSLSSDWVAGMCLSRELLYADARHQEDPELPAPLPSLMSFLPYSNRVPNQKTYNKYQVKL